MTDTSTPAKSSPARLIDDELDLLAELVPLAGQHLIELGCGNARLARTLLDRYPDVQLTGLEVDQRQHAQNLAAPQPRLHFVAAGAQAIPFADAGFDGALMLKSLHHVPLPLMAQALDDALRTGRWEAAAERRFETPVQFQDFADFEQRMMRPTFADYRIDDAMLAKVCERFAPHAGPGGAHFTRPMQGRLSRRA